MEAVRILDAGLQSGATPQGFVRRENSGLATDRMATAIFDKDGQVLTIKVKRHPDPHEFQRQLNSEHTSFQSKNSNVSQLGLGDISLIWLVDHKWWRAEAANGLWSCRVWVEFRDFESTDNAKQAATDLLKSLVGALPGQDEKQVNLLWGRPAPHCSGEISLLLQTSLGELGIRDLVKLKRSMGVTSETMEQLSFNKTAAKDLAKHRDILIAAAERCDLAPEIVASAVLSEIRGLDRAAIPWAKLKRKAAEKGAKQALDTLIDWLSEEHPLPGLMVWSAVRSVEIADEYIGIDNFQNFFGFDELYRDELLSLCMDVSIGVSQRQVGSLKKMGVPEKFEDLRDLKGTALDVELRKRLIEDETAIGLCAQFIRNMADQAAEYDGPREQELRNWLEKRGCGSLDLEVLSEHSSQWQALHVTFLGWKYNTGHLDALDQIPGVGAWGDMFLQSYADIVRADLF